MKPKYNYSFAASFPTRLILSCGLAVAGFSSQVHADNNWDGGGTVSAGLWNWSDVVNGGLDVAPTLPGSLTFAGTRGLLSNNNLSSQTLNGITFNGGAGTFTLSGNAITLGGNITNNGAKLQTINLAMDTTAARTVTTSVGGGDIALGGVISGAAGGITKTGTGTLTLTGTNTYTGVTIFAGGIVNVATFTNFGVAGGLGNRASDSASNVGLLFQGGTLQYTGPTAQSTNRGIRLSTTGGGGVIDASGSNSTATLSFTATSSADLFEVGGNRGLTLTGTNTGNNIMGIAITEAGGVTNINKSGIGTWILTGASTYGNSYASITYMSGGTLQVGNGTTGSTGAARLFFQGTSKFIYQGVTTGSSQVLGNNLTFSAGEGTVQSTYGGTSGNTILNVGSLAARSAGATGNFVISGGTNGSTNIIKFANTAPTAGALIDRGLFFNGSSYATYNTGGTSTGYIRAFTSGDTGYAAAAGGSNTIVTGSTTNVALGGSVTSQAAATISTLNLGANSLGLNTGVAFQTDGILQSGGASTISGGTSLSTATASGELVVRTNLSTDTLGIGTPIVNNTGTTALTLGGAGTLTLSSANTFTGTTTINSGTLSLTGSLTGGGAINVTGTGVLTESSAGVISGGGAVSQASSATSLLSGINTYTGSTTVSAGTLRFAGSSTGTLGAITVAGSNGAQLNIEAGTYVQGGGGFYVGTTTGAGTVTQSGGALSWNSGNLELLIGNGGAGTYNLSGGSITTFGASTRGIIMGVNSSSSATFNLSGTGSLNASNAILQIGRSDSGGNAATNNLFNQTGGSASIGTLTMGSPASDAANNMNMSATLNLTGGTFSVTNSFTLNAASGGTTSVINVGGTAQVTLPVFPTARGTNAAGSTATITFDSTSGGAGYLAPAAASPVYMPAGSFTHAYLTANGANFNVANTLDITVAQVLENNPGATGALTKSGVGALTLSGPNTYTGTTTIAGGTLGLANSSAIGSTGNIVFTGGTLQYSASNTTDYSSRINSATSTSAVSIDTNGQNVTFATGLSTTKSGGLTKTGSGSLTLTGTNAYTGTTTISGGTLIVGSSTALINMGALAMSGSGTLDLHGFNASFSNNVANYSTNTITNSGTSDVTLSFPSGANGTGALLTDGSTNKLALAFQNSNSGFLNITNPNNTFSGGLFLLNNSGGTRLRISSLISTTGTAGAITASTFGRGAITIGTIATDHAGILFDTVGNNTMANAIVFNTALGTDVAGVRFDTTGNVLSGAITANSNAAFAGVGAATISGAISGAGGLVTTAGSFTLSGANSFLGATTITSGSLTFAKLNSMSASSAVTVGATGTLGAYVGGTGEFSSGSATNGTVQGLLAGLGGQAGSTVTWTAGGSLALDTTNAGGSFTLSTAIANTGAGALGLGKLGSGTLVLAGSNTYTGTTTLGSGTLSLGSSGALSSGSANITFSGGTLQYGASNTTDYSSRITSGTSTGTVSIDTNGQNVTFASGFTSAQSGGLTKTGTGTLTLTGTNAYGGSTNVTGGTLSFAGSSTGTLGSISVAGSGTTQLNIQAGSYTLGGVALAIGAAGAGTVNQSGGSVTWNNSTLQLLIGNAGSGGAGTYNLSGGTLTLLAGTGDRGIILGVNPNANGTFNLSGSGTLIDNGVLEIGRSEGGATSSGTTDLFTQTGGTATVAYLSLGGTGGGTGISATMTLTGGTFSANSFTANAAANTNTSAITIGGTAQVTLPVIPTAHGTSSTATITFDSTTGGGGFLAPQVASAAYMPAGTFTHAYLTANGANFNVATGKDITVAQVLENNSGAAGALTKTGVGALTLSGANTYTGSTTINAGSLSINGSTSSGAVTVNNAGTKLMGTGTVGGNTTINSGAILAPGSGGVGKQTFANNLTSGSDSIFEWELAAAPVETGRGTSYDAVNVAGTLGGGGAVFRVVLNGSQDFSGVFWDTNRTWTDIFMTADGGTNVNYASLFSSVQYYNNSGTVSTAGQGAFTMSGSTLTWTAVPEPTGALAGLLLGASLLRRRR